MFIIQHDVSDHSKFLEKRLLCVEDEDEDEDEGAGRSRVSYLA